MINTPQPSTEFDWSLYADATFAGLSILIPIPVVDWLFEQYFRARMPRAIAKRRDQTLEPAVVKTLNRRFEAGCLRGCLTVSWKALIWLIKRISRKILYFLTVKEATDMISYYWHQAFLMDYMLVKGHLAQEATALPAREAMDATLATVTISPLLQLAKRVTAGTRHILQTLRRARQGDEDDLIEEKRGQMQQDWTDFADYLAMLAAQYDRAYQDLQAGQEEG